MSADEGTAVDGGTDTDADHGAEEHEPRGTMLIALVFLLATAVVWVLTYVTLLSRG